MSALTWQDWSCTVRVVLADSDDANAAADADAAPTPGLARRAEQIVRGLMRDVDTAVSRFRDDSELALVNRMAGRLVPVSPLTLRLVDTALDAARRTDGACDPTVGAAVRAAGYDDDISVVRARTRPRATARRAPFPVATAGWRRVRLDRDLRRIGVPTGLELDLGATAKAWTADEAARRLHAALDLPALVSLGGDVATSAGGVWPVHVAETEGGEGEVVRIAHGGIATSSTMSRRWPAGATHAPAAAETHHHVIDPRTGRPARSGLRTATVIANNCVRANAYSTAALVWGLEALQDERLVDRAVRTIDDAGRRIATDEWPDDGPGEPDRPVRPDQPGRPGGVAA